jgi:rhodanese-related sulfurtransferase
MTVHELADLIQKGKDAAQFIDVREEREFEIAKLPHFDLLPLSRYVFSPS